MTSDNISRDTADRMDLPFAGLATFAHQPAYPDWDRLDGTMSPSSSVYRSTRQFGSRAIREVYMFHGFGAGGRGSISRRQ